MIQAQKIAPAKKLLDAKGVPFSAESLLRPDWKTTLGPVLTQMPEMQVSRSVGNHIDGVQMADTLYLSENVKVTADTVIIARKIVFEGRDAVIKGPHNVYYFPLETDGVLGMSLDEAVGKKFGFTNNEWKSNEAETLKEFTPTLLKDNWSVTIDTSGYGWQDWVEHPTREKTTASTAAIGGELPVDGV